MDECWKDIPGFEGYYQISDLGRVKSLYTGKLRAAVNAGSGYRAVALSKHGTKKNYYVHRLVAGSFLENRGFPEYEVNHKNCDKFDNRVENLEWVSRFENMKHAYQNGKTDFRRNKRCDNKSGCPGVYARPDGFFEVSIGRNQKKLYLGYFHTLTEAINARKIAERRLSQVECT